MRESPLPGAFAFTAYAFPTEGGGFFLSGRIILRAKS